MNMREQTLERRTLDGKPVQELAAESAAKLQTKVAEL